jgi:hypothetical protein
MGDGHSRAVTALLASGLCGLLAAGPAGARPALSLFPSTLPAQAQPQSSLVVAVVPQNPQADEVAARLNYVARQGADRSGRFATLRLSDALDPQSARARQERAKEAQARLAAAQDAYNNLDTVKALKEADLAMKAWADTDLTLHIGELTQAWLFKIASHVANGETKVARAEIDRLVAVNPDAQFSSNYFPPEDIAYSQQAKKAVAEAAGTLAVNTEPPGAEIYVNGRFGGISPLTVQGLGDAEHFITALRPGFALAQARSRPGTVSLTLQPAEAQGRYEALVRGVTRDPKGPGRDAAARDFGQWLGVDQVLLVHVAPPRGRDVAVTGLRLDSRDGHNLAHATAELPTLGTALLQKADGFVAGLLAEDARRRGGPVTHFESAQPANTRRTVGFALLGTGAAAVAVGTFFGVRALGQQGTANRLAQARNPEAFSAASTGRTWALVADLSWLGGLAAAGAGGYLAFAGPKSEPAPRDRARAPRTEDPAAARPQKRRDDDDLRNH